MATAAAARALPGRALLAWLTIMLVSQACSSLPARNPLPEEKYAQAQVLDIPGARFWGDADHPMRAELLAMSREEARARFSALVGSRLELLAISGGGENGAFGAGLLSGWTASGERPEFAAVTGISTGALIAPFAYLGPEYDHVLEEIYTSYSTKDIVETRGKLEVLRSDAVFSTRPLKDLLAKYVDENIMAAIAAQYREGRLLFIGTTNIDAGRPVTWDIGAIASSGKPGALQLIRDVMLASASIPVAFPPVTIQVETDGQTYDEMHVDGGASRQAFLFGGTIYPQQFPGWLDLQGTGRAYVIRNAKLAASWEPVDRRILAIAGRSAGSMVRTQGIGDLYREYVAAQTYGLEFLLALIPEVFQVESHALFDREYMRALYRFGFDMAKNGYPWQETPPGVSSR